MGGRLKAGSFTALEDAVGKHARCVYAIGESRGLIREALGDVCARCTKPRAWRAAVIGPSEAAEPGDTVLLSPGCSSFDMFRDYAERGDAFRRAFQRPFPSRSRLMAKRLATDRVLLGVAVILFGAGLLMLWSASQPFSDGGRG